MIYNKVFLKVMKIIKGKSDYTVIIWGFGSHSQSIETTKYAMLFL